MSRSRPRARRPRGRCWRPSCRCSRTANPSRGVRGPGPRRARPPKPGSRRTARPTCYRAFDRSRAGWRCRTGCRGAPARCDPARTRRPPDRARRGAARRARCRSAGRGPRPDRGVGARPARPPHRRARQPCRPSETREAWVAGQPGPWRTRSRSSPRPSFRTRADLDRGRPGPNPRREQRRDGDCRRTGRPSRDPISRTCRAGSSRSGRRRHGKAVAGASARARGRDSG